MTEERMSIDCPRCHGGKTWVQRGFLATEVGNPAVNVTLFHCCSGERVTATITANTEEEARQMWDDGRIHWVESAMTPLKKCCLTPADAPHAPDCYTLVKPKPPTPAELFDRAGRALFGDHYVAPLAYLLGAEKGTVRNWSAGKSRVPPGVWGQITAALLKRGPEIEGVFREIGAVVAPEIADAHDQAKRDKQEVDRFIREREESIRKGARRAPRRFRP